MNDGRPTEVHYINTGFPYTVTESFMEFFEGLTHVPANYAHAGPMHDQSVQESVYWSMNMNPYKFGFSGPGSSSYYGSYEVNYNLPRMEVNRGEWEYPSTMTAEEPTPTDSPSRRDGVTGMQTIPEECSPNRHDSSSAQVIWQDNIDPDNMTYEELLDLGEAVGTQSRGLSQELIDLLPTSKFKFGSLFKRKKFGKRCVICQMTYRRGDQQIKLPCRHVYHGECITKWLSINKKCPVCNVERWNLRKSIGRVWSGNLQKTNSTSTSTHPNGWISWSLATISRAIMPGFADPIASIRRQQMVFLDQLLRSF